MASEIFTRLFYNIDNFINLILSPQPLLNNTGGGFLLSVNLINGLFVVWLEYGAVCMWIGWKVYAF